MPITDSDTDSAASAKLLQRAVLQQAAAPKQAAEL